MYKIFDLHCDTVLALRAKLDLSKPGTQTHIDIPRLRQGGISMQIFACFISSTVPEQQAFNDALELIAHIRSFCRRYSDRLTLVKNKKELLTTMLGGNTAIMIAVENGHVLQQNPDRLPDLYASGVRYLTLTHSRHLSWAASSGEHWEKSFGLSSAGVEIVKRMNDLDMIIDVSHVHERTFWDVMAHSTKPVIASHSNCAAICPTGRNLSDAQIEAIANKQGMIGINFYPGFLDKSYMEYQYAHCEDIYLGLEAVDKKYAHDHPAGYRATDQYYKSLQKRMAAVRVTYKRIADHVMHIVNLVGDEYVGFGSDFDGIPALPAGISGCHEMPKIITELQMRGLDEDSLERICHKNFLRVLELNETKKPDAADN